MKRTLATKVILPLFLIAVLTTTAGCDSVRGGAQIYLEDVSMGALSMEGKPIQGLPTGKMDIVLKVSANKVNISTTESGAIIKLSPSGATIIAGPDGMSITGVDPDKIEMKWKTAQ